MILGIFIIFAILIFFSWAIYDFLCRTYDIQKRKTRNVLFGGIIFLFFSFAISSVLTHYWDNALARGIYFSASIVLGFFLSFLACIAIAWIIILFLKIFKINYSWKIAGSITLMAAAILTCWGIYNAYHLQETDITVKIKNLPPQWEGKKIVQISDVHLGNVMRENYLNKLVEKVNEVKPDVVVITGDLFDGMDGDMDIFVDPLNKLKAKDGIYYITGNHELYLGLIEPLNIIKKTNIKVLNNEAVDIDGLQLIGINYPPLVADENLAEKIKADPGFSKGKPTILLFHPPISIDLSKKGNGRVSLYWRPDSSYDAAKDLGVDLQLSGHTHDGQVFPAGFFTDLIFHGYGNGLNSDGDFQIYTSSGAGVWGPTMRTAGKTEFVVITLEKK